MKKNLPLPATYLVILAGVFFLFNASVSYAQTDSLTTTGRGMQADPPPAASLSYRKNNVKINLFSLLLNNYNFSYERLISRKISVVGGYRFMPVTTASKIMAVERVIKALDDESSVKDDLSKIAVGNNAFTGEVRFYTGRHPGARGFYFSFYGRYANFKVDYDYDYETQTKTYSIPLRSSSNGFGVGLMLGQQWLIAKRVTLDWYIVGGHYGKLTGNINGLTDLQSLSSQQKQELREDINSILVIKDKEYVESTVNDNGVHGKVDAPFVGVRGLGFSLGIAF